MLSANWADVRLFLHVMGAAVWVGGQLTLAGLVPGLRGISAEAPRAVARAFAIRLAWPAFVLLIGTGVWNMVAVHSGSKDHAWKVTLWVKLAVVLVSGVAAYAHSRARSRGPLAVWGALTGLSAILALFLGVMLAG